MSYLAASLLAVSFTAAVVRYLLVGLTGSGNPMQALSSTVLSAGMMVGYRGRHIRRSRWSTRSPTRSSAFPIVGEGLQRTVGVLFGGACSSAPGACSLLCL